MAWLCWPLLALGGACEDEAPSPPPAHSAPAAAANRVDPAAAARKRETCRDSCEQLGIMTGNGDAELRACRARCDGRFAPPPAEAPRSISVAPAKRSPPNVRPR